MLMKNHVEISPYAWQDNPMEALNKRWALLTAGNMQTGNTMTVSWGGVGVLWNKPVVFVFVRPQRHTMGFLTREDCFSLSFFAPGTHQKELAFCGKASGRDVNKFATCGFSTDLIDGSLVINEADTVVCCKKLFVQRFSPESFTDNALRTQNYPYEDYHWQFVGEITHLFLPDTPSQQANSANA